MTTEHTVQSLDFGDALMLYEGKWVAIDESVPQEVIASGGTLDDVLEQVSPEQRDELLFFRVLPRGVIYAPQAYEVPLHQASQR